MNSSTSNSRFRRFGLGFLILAFVPGLCLFVLGIWLEPLSGDLTRIGGFSERDFGWQRPQIGFKTPLPADEVTYQVRDIWVLGDSFATAWPKLQWQNHLSARTGWSVGTTNINRVSLDQLLLDPEFKRHPPKLLILESAERYLTLRVNETPHMAARKPLPPQQTPPGDVITRMPTSGDREPFFRSQALGEVQLPFAGRFLLRTLQREILGRTPGNALRLQLSRNDLFSNRAANSLLIFREDLQKEFLWRQMSLQGIEERLASLRRKVEANGVTRLIVLVAPDKLTAYRKVLKDPVIHPYTELPELTGRAPDLMPDLLHAMETGIAGGTMDLYLPDDTHWGSSGQERVAATLIDFIHARFSDLF